MTVWVYASGDDVRVFSTRQKANAWIRRHDPEGVAIQSTIDDGAPLE